jgi:hypothetical protein
MVDMLSYETCCKLRDAQFPQEQGGFFYELNRDGTQRANKFLAYFKTAPPYTNKLRCPNSDELLAALQARWPELQVYLRVDKVTCSATARDWGVVPHRAEVPEAATPAAALAALYIELAKEPTHD